MYRKSLHRFTILLTGSTLLLLAAGGMVTSTGSGLAVPDWPLSYGKLMPPMVGGIFYEHGHRMIASGVGFLTVILAFWIWRVEERRWVRNLGLAALGGVIIQGLLGGLTVKLLLPTWVSSTHATLAQIFFCTVSILALTLSRWWIEQSPSSSFTSSRRTVIFSGALAVGIFLQLVVGAVMRHSDAGLVVPDFPFAYGQVFPSVSPDSLQAYQSSLIHRDLRMAGDGPLQAEQIVVHLLHRYWGMSLVLIAIVGFSVVVRTDQGLGALRRVGVLIPVLLIVQGFLGYYTIISRKDEVIATLHQTNGAIVLASTVLYLVIVMRLRHFRRETL